MTLSVKIEFTHFSVLSDRDLNCQNDIQLFLQQCDEKLRVNGDTGQEQLIGSHLSARFGFE